tara:strand:- start:4829 stop:5875 length:1047 start_codon:yes stop_codon:yes gene_type:complete
MDFKFGKKYIGDARKAFLIAEVAQAHDGSLGYAHSFIDAASEAGVDAVKFQAHFAQYESTLDEPFRVNFSYEDNSRYDYWQRMEFTKEQWVGLKDHAESKELEFLCTPFSSYAVDLLDDIGVVGWKIGSGDVGQKWLLEQIAQTRKPVIFSTGMSSIESVDSIYKYFKNKEIDFSILQCTSMYPTPLENTEIDVFLNYMQMYDVPIGLSNHSGTVWPAVYAIALGAKVIEVHIKLNDFSFGPDTSSSLSVEQLKTIVEAREAFSVIEDSKNQESLSLDSLNNDKQMFSRSVTLNSSYTKGTIIKENMILMRKPGSGIPESEVPNLIGKTLCRDYDSNYLLDPSDLETS